jgi:hypothetical protein
MADFDNETPFAALALPSLDRQGVDVLLIIVAAHFELPDPGYGETRLHLAATQEPPSMVEEYVGEPGRSSIRRDGQSPYLKPATDIHVVGDACAPNDKPVTQMRVSVRVGPCAVDMRVYGDRVWERSAKLNVRPSDPMPFLRMPLVWERAYGGVATSSTEERPVFEPRNPIGCGLETTAEDAIDKPVPNIEHPRQPLDSLADRPEPAGVGPIGRDWQPRVGYAGTYDDRWRRARAPLWPDDFDERFFCSAPSYLQASPHLTGGEAVQLQGLHPGGEIAFRLPALRLASLSRFLGHDEQRAPVLDGVSIDTSARRLTMYYRASVLAPLSLIKHRRTSLHLLRSGEDRILE